MNYFLTLLLFLNAETLISQDFITQWNLNTAGSGATQITFPVTTTGIVNYTWTTVPSSLSGSGTFTGTVATITGLPAGSIIRLSIQPTNFNRIRINFGSDRNRLTLIDQWGAVNWSNMSNAFYGCSNVQVSALDTPNLTSVTDLSYMFYQCTSLNSPNNINSWNVSNITNMSFMFYGDPAFNQDLSSWNTSNVTNMASMFRQVSAFNQNIQLWNVANVTNMSNMFQGASAFNQPIGSWNTSAVTNMSYLFSGCINFNQDITNWVVSNVTDMSYMFKQASVFNQNISAWNTSNVTNMAGMFQQANVFNQNISSWNTSNVTNMAGMFQLTNLFNQPIGTWNTSNVTNMSSMFEEAIVFNQNIGSWNTTNVTNMAGMFNRALVFNQNISTWNTSNVTNMTSMFSSARLFNQPIGSWNTSAVTNMSYMFYQSNSSNNFNQPIGSWNTANVTDMSLMFFLTQQFNQNISTWNTANVTSMQSMFQSSNGFNQSLGGWTLNPNVDLTNIFNNSVINCANYSSTLNGWNINPLTPNGRNLGATGRTYGPQASSARSNLVLAVGSGGKGWTITDAGLSNTIPTFSAIAPVCYGATISNLPTTSTNGITGTWSPAINNTSTTTYTFTPNSNHCASTTDLTITIIPTNTVTTATVSPSTCSNNPIASITHSTTGATGIGSSTGLPLGISAIWNSNTITISGTSTNSGVFNYNIPLTGGCGTVNATGSITVLPTPSSTYTNTICNEEEIVINGVTFNSTNPSGIVVFLAQGSNGCDSIVNINLTVLPPSSSNITNSICHEDSIIINGNVYNYLTPSGVEIFSNSSSNGCDSTVYINLTILPELNSILESTICFNDSIIINGTVYNSTNPIGTEVFTNASVNGCDSIVNVNLTVLPQLISTNSTSICYSDSIIINGNVYNATNSSGIEVFSNIGQFGCDSTVNINLIVLPEINTSYTISNETITSAISGAQYQWFDCNGFVPLIGETNQSFTPVANGNYAFELTIGNCTERSECIEINSTNIIEKVSYEPIIYPNPVNDFLYVQSNKIYSNLKIYNITGSVVLNIQSESEINIEKIDVSNLNPGAYFIEIQNNRSIFIKQ